MSQTGDFRFHIAEDGVNFDREVFPVETSKIKFTSSDNLENGEVFARRKISGKLVFVNKIGSVSTGDYDYLNTFETDTTLRCQSLYVRMQIYCGYEWFTFWTGIFSTSGGFFDKDNCRFEITPDTYDRYYCILKNQNRKFNILEVDPIESSVTILPDFEYHVCRDDDPTVTLTELEQTCLASAPSPSGTWVHLKSDDNGDDKVVVYFRERAVVNCQGGVAVSPGGSDWVLSINDCGGTGTATYVRKPVVSFSTNSIQVGGCDPLNDDEQPPPLVDHAVTIISGSPNNTFFDVSGFEAVMEDNSYFYRVTAPTSSTLLWSVLADPDSAVASLANTTAELVTVNLQVTSGVISAMVELQCVETTVSGAIITHRIDIVVRKAGDPTESSVVNSNIDAFRNFQFLGPKVLCTAQENIRYYVPDEFQPCGPYTIEWRWQYLTSLTITAPAPGGSWPPITSTGWVNMNINDNPFLELVSQSNTEMIVRAKGFPNDNTLTADIQWIINNWPGGITAFPGLYNIPFRLVATVTTCEPFSSNLLLTQISHDISGITIRKEYVTEPIQGDFTPEANSTGVVYSVHERSGATFEWTVTGGTIASGQGTNEITVDWGASGGSGFLISVKESSLCGCGVRILVTPCTAEGYPAYYWCDPTPLISYSTGRLLYDVIVYMLEQMGCVGYDDVVSDFFEWNAIGDAPGYVAGVNYITGNSNLVNYLTVHQKSDVKTPAASNPATVGELSFKEVMLWLKTMFRVYWDVEEDGTVRFEHYKYFTYPVDLDLTLAAYEKQVRSMNKYTHINQNLPRYERFKWMEAKNRDFIGSEIWYDTPCVNVSGENDAKEYNLSNLTTDIAYIDQNPDEISPQGFTMVANSYDGLSYEVITDTGALTGESKANAPLSWANLHRDFHTWDRLWRQGYLNNELTTFDGFLPTVKQNELTIKYCCEIADFDAKKKVRTELGQDYLGGIDAFCEKAEYTPYSHTLKLSLQYAY